jgi:hypothetical protein
VSQAEPAIAASGSEALASINARLAALRAAGADRLDPTAMHFLEALARRAASQAAAVRAVLETRMEQATVSLEARLQQARARANDLLSAELPHFSQAEETLQAHAHAGDVPGLKRALSDLRAQARSLALSDLTRQLEQEAARHAGVSGARPELKTLRNARTTWSRLSADKQVAQALAQAPKNAGPINSHMLMLRSLELMREISPDYLHRFISYADSLLRLEECAPKQAEKADKVDKKRVRTLRSKTV